MTIISKIARWYTIIIIVKYINHVKKALDSTQKNYRSRNNNS